MPEISVVYFNEAQAAAHPVLQDLVAVKSTSIAQYRPAFEALLRSDFLPELVTGILQDPEGAYERLDTSCEELDWRLLRTEIFSLGLRKLPGLPSRENVPEAYEKPVRRIISALPNDALVGVLGSGCIVADVYRSSYERDQDVFDRGHRIELVERRELRGGDLLMLAAGEDLVDFVDVRGDVVTVELAIRQAKRIVWNYDLNTLQAAFASSASVEATRMEFAVELFRIFKERQALQTLAGIAKDYTHHWVHWKAVKTLLEIDVAAGVQALEVAVFDSHEHVRGAARKTLDNLRAANIVS